MSLRRFLMLGAALAWFGRDGARGQVVVQFTPEPMEVLKSLKIRKIGLWTAAACNNGAQPVAIAPERFRMAAPNVRMIDNARAAAILQRARGSLWQSRLAEWLLFGGLIAAGAGAVGGLAPNVVAGLTGAAGLGATAALRLQSELPSLEPFKHGLLDGPTTLAAGACSTGSFFAALQHGAAPFESKIEVKP